MAAFVNDTFTDTNGTLLQNHTGETGATWTKLGAGDTQIQSNAVSKQATGTSEYSASGSPPSAEYGVQADVSIVSSANAGSSAGVLGRVQSATTYYLADYSVGSPPQWRLFKRVSGSFTSLGTFNETFTGAKTLKLEILDASKKVYVNGVERISSADNEITLAGSAGLRQDLLNSGDFGNATLDNYSAATADTGEVRPAVGSLALMGVGR